MPILSYLKNYLIRKTANKYNLAIMDANDFINAVERKATLLNYEQNLTNSETFTDLFNFYFKEDK